MPFDLNTSYADNPDPYGAYPPNYNPAYTPYIDPAFGHQGPDGKYYPNYNPNDPYQAGLIGLEADQEKQDAASSASTQPYVDATTNNYWTGAAARQGVLDQQSGALGAFSSADAGLFNDYGTFNQGLATQGNQSVSTLGASLGQANSLDAANVAELGGALNQSTALGQSSYDTLRNQAAGFQQLTAGGYGADVTSNPEDVARQEGAYDALGGFASGQYDYTSQAAQAYADPEAVAAQKDALAQFKEQSKPQLTDAERYLYMQARLQEEQSQRANRDANLRELERSGMSGSTMALSNLNASSQQASNTRALEDLGANAEAIKRAQAALVNYGNMASTISGQSFDQAYKRGAAADTASQFNTNTRLQGTVQQGQLATQMRTADDALAEFNKAQSLQQQRFQDQYRADQQQQAWQRDTDVAGAGFKQAGLESQNAAIKSNAGFQQSQDISRNAGTLSNAELTNLRDQGDRYGNYVKTGAQMNSDWLTGEQNLGQMGLTAQRDNTTALGTASDAAFKQRALGDDATARRDATLEKAMSSQAEDVRAAHAEAAAAAQADADREAANTPHSAIDALFG